MRGVRCDGSACDDVSVGIERERLELEPFSLEGQPGKTRVRRPNGESFPLAPEHEAFLELAARGVSPQQMALHGWSSGRPFSFRSLARFIAFLCEKRLIKNASAYEFAESLRPGFAWRRSLVSEPLMEIEVVRWGPGRRRPILASVFSALVLALAAMGFLYIVYLLGSAYHARLDSRLVPFSRLGTRGHFWSLLGFGFLWISCARSAVGLVKFIAVRLASGETKALRFAVDLCSIRVESTDASLTQRKSGAEAFAAFASMAAPFSAAAFLLPLDLGPEASTAAALFFPVGWLIETSPFTRGPLTDLVRYLYNWKIDLADSRPERPAGTDPESSVAAMHVVCSVIWVIVASSFFGLPFADLVRFAREWMVFPDSYAKISAFVFFGFAALVALSFLDDIANAVSYGANADRVGVRRLWRLRSRRTRDRALADAASFKNRAALESAPVLRQLSPAGREAVIKRSALVSYDKGEAICRQGDAKRELYVLLSGRAAVQVRKSGGRRKTVMVFEPGSVFGEVGFFLGQTRTADVIALEPCVALEIRRQGELGELDPERSGELRDRIRFLQALASSSFLRDLPGEAHDALAALGHPRSFPAGTRIVREGEAGDECYFVVQGTATAIQGRDPVSKLGPGDAFGEIALLRLQPFRTATVVTDVDMLAMELKGARLWELMSAHLSLALEIERLAQHRLARDAAVRSSGAAPA